MPRDNDGRLRVVLRGDLTWAEEGACFGTDNDRFFSHEEEDQEWAKSLCRGCERRFECLLYALNNNLEEGVWGGFNGRELYLIRKRGLKHELPQVAARTIAKDSK